MNLFGGGITTMARPSYTLADNFELKGIWWLPEKPDTQISGVLAFDNEKKISLELLGSFRELTSLGGRDFFQPELILGISDVGHICTLFRNIETNSQLNFPGIQKSIIETQYLFIGKHFKSPDDIIFPSLKVSFTNLENWLTIRPFSLEIPDNKENKDWKLIHKWPSEFKSQLAEIESYIESTHEFNTGGNLITDAIWKSKAFLQITPNEAKDFKWYWGMMYDLCNLLTLLIGETTFINQVKALGNDVKIGPDKTTKENIELFFTQKKVRINKEIHHFEMILPFPRIFEQITDVLSLWFTKATGLRSVYDLFFGTFYNPGMYLQFHFLSLMQALEIFHRVTKGGKYLSNDDWKPFRATLANAIPAELDSGHKDSLKSRIKYGNEYSLRKRIGELLESLDEQTLLRLSPTNKYFTGVLVDTRNYLTHYDDELKDVALKDADLYWANQRLRILISLLLLKEIGIQEKLILDQMTENNKIRQILDK
jgi:hypothetical protein